MIPQNDQDFYEFLKVYPMCSTISDKDKKVLSLLINTPGHIRRDRVVGTDEYWPTDENGEMTGPRYKKYALEFDMDYTEFPPAHYSHNMHCKLPPKHYNKPYYVSNYFKRNKQIAEYSNIIVAFIPDGVESRGTMDTVGHAQKLKKMIKIINQYIFIYVYIEGFFMDYKLTSVKILEDLYKKFKLKALSD